MAFAPETGFAGRQLLGDREEQQDAYAFCPVESSEAGISKLLVVVADGVGGHLGGRQAAQTAVRSFIDGYFFALDNMAFEMREDDESDENLTQRIEARALWKALDYANERLADVIDADPGSMQGAGTTLLAVLMSKTEFRWISVGDSPLLLYSADKKLQRLNADHSLRLEAAEGKGGPNAPQPNTITSALAGSLIPLIDGPSSPQLWGQDDVLLAASDGILTLNDQAIAASLKDSGREAVQKASQMVAKIKGAKKKRQDNATVAVVLSPKSDNDGDA